MAWKRGGKKMIWHCDNDVDIVIGSSTLLSENSLVLKFE